MASKIRLLFARGKLIGYKDKIIGILKYWILESGSWNDNGIWIDDKKWRDN